MAADLVLLKSFVDGQGVGAANYFVYAEDLDSNFTSIENTVNAINQEVKGFAGQNAPLASDLIKSLAVPTGFVNVNSFTPVTFITADTQMQIPVGIAFTAPVGRVQTFTVFTLTGSGGAGARFVALTAGGQITLETLALQQAMDLYSVDWDGAAFTTATLLRLESILPAGEDFQDSLTVVGVPGGAIPAQTHDQIANRFENIERALNGLRTNFVPGGPPIGPVLSLFRGGRLKFVSASTVTLGSASVVQNLVPDSTASFTIEWPGASPLTIDITVAGAGGLDTGVEAASTWYAAYVIADTSGVNPVVGLFSLSPISPTLPAGYDIFFRMGWVRNDAALNFLEFLQTNGERNRHYLWVNENLSALNVLSGGSALSFATVSLSAFVPLTARRVMMTYEFDGNVAGADFALRVPGALTTRANSYFSVFLQNAAAVREPSKEVWTDENQDIEYEVNSGASALDLWVTGFTDELAGLL